MRLSSHHVESLTPLEKKVYASLIGNRAQQSNRKQYFISQSQKYVEGDESVLPFPERSTKGIMLSTLSEQSAKENVTAAFMSPQIPHFAGYIKDKSRALGAPKVYTVPPKQIEAAIYGNGESPFNFYREGEPLHSNGSTEGASLGIDESPEVASRSDSICAINPPPKLVTDTPEYKVLAISLKASAEVEELNDNPLFPLAAHLGLHQVDEIPGDRSWLTKESS